MANEIQIKKRVEAIQARMLEILKHLATQVERKAIKSEAELQHRVFHSLQDFYKTIGEPTFKPIPANHAPYKDDHNSMMSSLHNDLHTLYQEIQNLTNDVNVNFERVDVERQSFLTRISEIEGIITYLDSKLKQESNVTIFQDNFTNVDNYLKEAVSTVPAYLSASERILTLDRIRKDNLNEYATITIIKGNGLPGNTHVARSVGSRLKFDGEDELHINLAHLLDGNADTWFEYELFELGEKEKELTRNLNLRYREGISWVREDVDALRCVMKIELPKEKNMNWFSLTPYIPNDRGATGAKIEKIVISDEKGTLKGMAFEENFDKGLVFIFPQQKTKTITLYLRQDVSYPTTIGHFYYEQVNLEETNVLGRTIAHDSVRVEGVLPSIESLGVSYDIKTGDILYSRLPYDAKIENEDKKKQELFTTRNLSSDGNEVLSGIEQLNASRYMLGVRDINLANHEFAATSEYISIPYRSDRPIIECQLEAHHVIPNEFPDGEWVKYFISIDDGRSWHPIYPKDTYQQGAKVRYVFNSKVPKQGRVDVNGYIDSVNPIHQLQLKIELSRPMNVQDAQFYTPYITGYELQVLTSGVN